MRVVFMGTPAYAATILEEISYQHDVACVYTRPDAVRGRGKDKAPSEVKQTALRLGLEVRTPSTLRDEVIVEELRSWDADVFVVAAYGAILTADVLSIPRMACLNAHASILPRWRGAAPIERAILAGDDKVGVCIMRMEEGLDTGDWCVCRTTEIADKTAGELTAELADLGARAMLTALSIVESGGARWEVQDEDGVTYAKKIEKHELDIAPNDDVMTAWRKVRASSVAHPSRIAIGGKSLTILSACPVDDALLAAFAQDSIDLDSGSVRLVAKRLVIGLEGGALELVRVKPDGKREMEGAAFATGLQGVKQGSVKWEQL